MEFLVGVTLALGVSLGATVAGLDRDRAFYAALALAIGTYNLLFAVMGGSLQALVLEIAAYAVLATIAIRGFRGSLWLIVAALAGHGVFDVFHEYLFVNNGVPDYWPMFCMSYDITAALYLAWLLHRRTTAVPRPDGVRPVSPYVQSEIDAAATSKSDAAESFRRLERAHVLSQGSTREHVRVHWHMLVWGLRQRDWHEVAGQILRIAGAATKTAFGWVPIGNTGGANVNPLKPMPVPRDLADILALASGGTTANPAAPRTATGPK
jgi:hypothetical protein